MKRSTILVVLCLALSAAFARPAGAQIESDRSVLPLAEPTHPPITKLDVRKATAPPLFQVKAP